MREIPLTQGKVALVDDEDYEYLSQFRWYAVYKGRSWYATRSAYQGNGRHTTVLLHRDALSLPPRVPHIDHEDGDGLNNQRYNLREATRSQNLANQRIHSNNTSGFKGVWWHKKGKKWQAGISTDGKRISLGLFDAPEEAARAYDAAAFIHHGEFARLNFGANQGGAGPDGT